jgi:hypothetical protein
MLNEGTMSSPVDSIPVLDFSPHVVKQVEGSHCVNIGDDHFLSRHFLLINQKFPYHSTLHDLESY